MSSRTYEYRRSIRLTISVLIIVLLVAFATAIYVGAERIVSEMQQKASRKMLASIDYNIKYMEDMLGSLSASAAADNTLVALMYGDTSKNKLEWVQGYSKMYELIQSASFLHSVTAYNGRMDDFYGTSDAFMADPEAYKGYLREVMRQADEPLMRGQLTPLAVEDVEDRVRAFSYYWFDSVRSYRPGLSFLSFNIKASWLFDNLSAVDGGDIDKEGGIFLLDKSGLLYAADGSQVQDVSGLLRQIGEHPPESGNGGGGYFRGQYLGKSSLISYRTSDMTNWTFVIVKPYREVMGDLLRMRSVFLWITGVMLFVALLSALIAAHRLYKPVRRVLSNIESSSLLPLPVSADNELEFISHVYDSLSGRLNDALREQLGKRNLMAAYCAKQLVAGSRRFSADELEDYRRSGLLKVGAEGGYRLILLQLDRYRSLSSELPGAELGLLSFAIVNIADELAGRDFICETVEVQEDAYIVLLHVPSGETVPAAAAAELASRIQQVVRDYYRVTLTAAIGGEIRDYTRISDSYDRLKLQIQYRLVYGRGAVITPEMLPADGSAAPMMPHQVEKKVAEALRSGQAAAVRTVLAELHADAARQDSDTILRTVLQLAHTIKTVVQEINTMRAQPISVSLGDLSRALMELETLEEMFERLSDICEELVAKLRHPDNDRNESLVVSVKQRVERDYTDINLNVQMIADELKFSSGHIGRVFKQYERVSVAEYINQVRMRRALELLTEGSHTINEIMTQVGYANQSYFFKLFKKTFGTTPREFRLSRVQDTKQRSSSDDSS